MLAEASRRFSKWAFKKRESPMSVAEAFAAFDLDGSGALGVDELRAVLSRPGGGSALSDAEIQDIIAEFDANGDGELQLEEFTEMWAPEEPAKPRRGSILRRLSRSSSSDAADADASFSSSADGSFTKARRNSILGFGRSSKADKTEDGAATDSFAKKKKRSALSVAPTAAGSPAAAGAPGTAAGSKADWLSAARRCVLLDGLPKNELNFVYKSSHAITTREGDVIFSQGDFPSCLYLVHSGLYRASVGGRSGQQRRARDYGEATSFGSCELLSHIGGRSCSVIALSGGVLWSIPRRVVETKLKIPPPLKIAGLLDFCTSVKLFETIASQRERLVQLCRGALALEFGAGDVIVEEGDEADAIYIVRKGSVLTTQQGSTFQLSLPAPRAFGESALFADEWLRKRQASVLAGAEGASVLRWPVAAIEALVGFELQVTASPAECPLSTPLGGPSKAP